MMQNKKIEKKITKAHNLKSRELPIKGTHLGKTWKLWEKSYGWCQKAYTIKLRNKWRTNSHP
jgi:hypothetical protein